MNSHPLVEELGLGALARTLNALHGQTIAVSLRPDAASIKAIHEGLLKLQRQSGSLGLNK